MLRLVVLSRLAGLHRRLSRWLGGEQPELDGIEEVPTISDRLDRTSLETRLPGEWHVSCELVQFRDEPLAEVVRLTNHETGSRLTLKPCELQAPTAEVDVYLRPTPQAARSHRLRAGSLEDGLDAAVRLATRRTTTKPTTQRSLSHQQQPTARQQAEF